VTVTVPSRQEGAAVPLPVTAREAAALGAADVLARLGSGPGGLAEQEAARRLRAVGPNAVRSHRARALPVLVSQLRSPLLVLLAVTAVVSAFLGIQADRQEQGDQRQNQHAASGVDSGRRADRGQYAEAHLDARAEEHHGAHPAAGVSRRPLRSGPAHRCTHGLPASAHPPPIRPVRFIDQLAAVRCPSVPASAPAQAAAVQRDHRERLPQRDTGLEFVTAADEVRPPPPAADDAAGLTSARCRCCCPLVCPRAGVDRVKDSELRLVHSPRGELHRTGGVVLGVLSF
jgi:Cation transporter/ATPase, N-terminus